MISLRDQYNRMRTKCLGVVGQKMERVVMHISFSGPRNSILSGDKPGTPGERAAKVRGNFRTRTGVRGTVDLGSSTRAAPPGRCKGGVGYGSHLKPLTFLDLVSFLLRHASSFSSRRPSFALSTHNGSQLVFPVAKTSATGWEKTKANSSFARQSLLLPTAVRWSSLVRPVLAKAP